MSHKVLALAGSPRRGGNSQALLDRAIEGVRAASPDVVVERIVLNDLAIKPCQNCGYCDKAGVCRFNDTDGMKELVPMLNEFDRFIVATPIFFANVTAQLKTFFDRCQPFWVKRFVEDEAHPNAGDRKALFLCCGGFDVDRFYKCTRMVMKTWCICLDIELSADLFYKAIDKRGDIQAHPTALQDAFEAGGALVGECAVE
jgi:putative NADPH-quinone reductase